MTDPDPRDEATGESRDPAMQGRPQVTVAALWLWYSAIALYAILAITGRVGSEEMRLDPGKAIADIFGQVVVCALMLIPVGALRNGRGWGRILLTCVALMVWVAMLPVLVPFFSVLEPLGAVVIVALLLASLCAVVASFHPHTNRWVASRRRTRR